MNAGPEDFAAAGNGFNYAVELDDGGGQDSGMTSPSDAPTAITMAVTSV